ncbi:hypothetical protein [Streptomyces sp. NPDC004270]
MRRIRSVVLITTAILAAGTATATAREGVQEPPPSIQAAQKAPHNQYFSASRFLGPGAWSEVFVSCPAGQVPTGGGFHSNGNTVFATDSYSRGSDWYVRARNTSPDQTYFISAFVICTVP